LTLPAGIHRRITDLLNNPPGSFGFPHARSRILSAANQRDLVRPAISRRIASSEETDFA
jgi:hypothetical protein